MLQALVSRAIIAVTKQVSSESRLTTDDRKRLHDLDANEIRLLRLVHV